MNFFSLCFCGGWAGAEQIGKWLLLLTASLVSVMGLKAQDRFPWPEGKRFALSVSFDDSNVSNLDYGIPILDEYGVKATFYVHPSHVQADLNRWKSAVASGHEIGNHTTLHPCSGNIMRRSDNCLDDYTLARMRAELLETNSQLEALLGIKPKSFAYPCGQTYVGRGEGKRSYVPLVAEEFVAGRGWLDETPTDPFNGDLSEVSGMKMDDMDFEEILPTINKARESGLWLVLVGHLTEPEHGAYTTRLDFLRKLSEYLSTIEDVWVAPVGEVASYVESTRTDGRIFHHEPLPVNAGADGVINLKASLGRARGAEIAYMPDWKAFGWWMSRDTVHWNVNVAEAGTYQVELAWSVSDEEAGKTVKMQVDGKELAVTIGKSGSWETFLTAVVGTLTISEGKHRFTIVPADPDLAGPLLDLRAVRLIPRSGSYEGVNSDQP